MLVALPLLTLALTGCSVNAPVTNDIHDNYVEIPNATINTPEWKLPNIESNQNPTPVNPLPSTDPNGQQDTPDSWGDDDVDPDLNIEPPLPSPSFSPPNT
jgi:hypothetical protein